MHKTHPRLRYSPVSLSMSVVAMLIVVYIGLIAVTMSYATTTIELAQSVRNDETAVAKLESHYLAMIAQISKTDYTALGYVKPKAKLFVPTMGGTALR